ncbi:MAG: cupin domain-containing protein [Anaerolineae bacterium]
MNVARFDKTLASPGHNGTILAMDVLPAGMRAPFQHAWGHLQPHSTMEGHSHTNAEIYFFHSGTGTVIVGDEEAPVSPGLVVEIPSDTWHTVRNDSDGELLWFALWWPPVTS